MDQAEYNRRKRTADHARRAVDRAEGALREALRAAGGITADEIDEQLEEARKAELEATRRYESAMKMWERKWGASLDELE